MSGASVATVRLLVMPTIGRFYGIVIRMYFSDHAPPHFHAAYGGEEAVVAIADGAVPHGAIPGRALRHDNRVVALGRELPSPQSGADPRIAATHDQDPCHRLVF